MKKMVLFFFAVVALACGNSRAVDNGTMERAEAPVVLQYDKEMFPDSNIVDDEIKLVWKLGGLAMRSSNLDVQDQLRFFRETVLPLILKDITIPVAREAYETLRSYKDLIFLSNKQPDSLRIPIKDLNIPDYEMKCDDSLNIEILPMPKGYVAVCMYFDYDTRRWSRGSEIFIIMKPESGDGAYKIAYPLTMMIA